MCNKEKYGFKFLIKKVSESSHKHCEDQPHAGGIFVIYETIDYYHAVHIKLL